MKRNRYQIAVDNKDHHDEIGQTIGNMIRIRDKLSRVTEIKAYLHTCAFNGKIWIADNVPIHALTQAVVEYSKKQKLPIVVEDYHTAFLLRTAYSYYEIYGVNDIPPDVTRVLAFLKKTYINCLKQFREHIEIKALIHLEVVYGKDGKSPQQS